jgi:hypothetical protein
MSVPQLTTFVSYDGRPTALFSSPMNAKLTETATGGLPRCGGALEAQAMTWVPQVRIVSTLLPLYCSGGGVVGSPRLGWFPGRRLYQPSAKVLSQCDPRPPLEEWKYAP